MPEEHHKRGPSSQKPLEHCPHFRNQESKNTRASDEGTALHEIIETYVLSLKAKKTKAPLGKLDLTSALVDMLSPLDDEQRGIVEVVCNHVHPLITKPKRPKVHAEIKLDCLVNWGTCDLAVEEGDGLVIKARDWKFGNWAVEHPRCNAQAWNYGIGLFNHFPKAVHIEFGFLQPRLDHEVELFTFNRDMLPAMVDRVSKNNIRADIASDHEAGLHEPGDVCTFCSRKIDCPSFAEMLEGTEIAELFSTSEPFEVPTNLDTEENRESAMLLAGLLKGYSDDMKSTLVDLWESAGLETGGHKLIQCNGKTTLPAAARKQGFETVILALAPDNAEDVIEVLKLSLGEKEYNKVTSALDMTISKLPGEALNALKTAKLTKTGDSYAYLKRV